MTAPPFMLAERGRPEGRRARAFDPRCGFELRIAYSAGGAAPREDARQVAHPRGRFRAHLGGPVGGGCNPVRGAYVVLLVDGEEAEGAVTDAHGNAVFAEEWNRPGSSYSAVYPERGLRAANAIALTAGGDAPAGGGCEPAGVRIAYAPHGAAATARSPQTRRVPDRFEVEIDPGRCHSTPGDLVRLYRDGAHIANRQATELRGNAFVAVFPNTSAPGAYHAVHVASGRATQSLVVADAPSSPGGGASPHPPQAPGSGEGAFGCSYVRFAVRSADGRRAESPADPRSVPEVTGSHAEAAWEVALAFHRGGACGAPVPGGRVALYRMSADSERVQEVLGDARADGNGVAVFHAPLRPGVYRASAPELGLLSGAVRVLPALDAEGDDARPGGGPSRTGSGLVVAAAVGTVAFAVAAVAVAASRPHPR